MAIKFNPLTGNFDFAGSGGGGASYIDGEEATYNDLSLSSTIAPLNSAWLVRSSSGIWPFNKPAGIYYRSATLGVSRDADYTYGGTLGDVFADNVFLLYDNGNTTRNLQFSLGGISNSTTRTWTAADRSGTVVVSDTSAGTGSDVVTNIVSLTTAEYAAIGSPDATTLYLVTDPS
jgi:hypothetical protein